MDLVRRKIVKMGVDLMVWRCRVGCFTPPPASQIRCIGRSPSHTLSTLYRLTLLGTLLFMAGVGAGTPPDSGTNLSWLTNYCASSQQFTCVSPANSTLSDQPLQGIRDGSMCQMLGVRHAAQLSTMLLIKAGIEQNPGPGPLRSGKQLTLDGAGNLRSDPPPIPASPIAHHSASQPEPTLGDIMVELRKMRAELRDDIKGVKTQVKQNSNDIEATKSRQAELEAENRELRERLAKAEQRVSQIDDDNRRNNVIVRGLPETGPETLASTEEKLKDSLVNNLSMEREDVEKLQIDRAQRIGKSENGSRLVKVVFANNKDKACVLRKAREVKPQGLYYRDDFKISTLEARNRLKPGLLAARESQYQAHLVHEKLVVQHQDKKNVYIYDPVASTVKALKRSFDDNIQWQRLAADESEPTPPASSETSR